MSKQLGLLKPIAPIALAFALQGCASTEPVKFSYSSEFALTVPVSQISGATVFSADGPALKTAEGQLLSGRVISNASEGLPDDFTIRDYPKLILGLDSPQAFDEEIARLFENSTKEIQHTYGDGGVFQETVGAFTIYGVCGDVGCLSFVTKADFEDHVLTVHGTGISKEEFTSLIKGGLHADR
ncbi:hypothetical protein ACJO2E_00705 [Marinobacter sp. M1N3S26]|uniref:hypothetical protein n=1 Tax=Marinobacter sp. M1N3S26 TaxID=3382299 RepID=UPI00387B914A